MVLARNDAWALARTSTDSAHQEILNRSKVYVSGTDFGLSLTERDPLNVQALPRSVPAKLELRGPLPCEHWRYSVPEVGGSSQAHKSGVLRPVGQKEFHTSSKSMESLPSF